MAKGILMPKIDLTGSISLSDIVGFAEKTCTKLSDLDRTGLIIIDMQGDPDEQLPSQVERALSGTGKVLQAARKAGIKVIHIVLGHWTLDGKDLEIFMQIERQAALDSGDEAMVKQTVSKGLWDSPACQIFASLAPIKGEIVLRKTSSSAFATTGMSGILHNMQVRDLVFCGRQTDGCCGVTALQAAAEGFMITMVEDACCANSRAGHLAMLRIIQQHHGRVSDSEKILTELAELDQLEKRIVT